MVPYPYRIQRVRKETNDTITLELEPLYGDKELSFKPGQFNMLYAFGVGEIPISISGDSSKPKILMQTVRAAGTVSKTMSKLRRGDVLGVRGPFGSHWPVEIATGNDIMIVAGGIGLAPLRSLLYYLVLNRDRYGKIILLYGARTPQDLLYKHELEEWRSRFKVGVNITVDVARGDWQGNVGVVTTLIRRAQFNPSHSVAMVCGPEIMMRFTVLELEKRGVRTENIFISIERNMKCAIGFCGHCQFGPTFVCKDGPVFCFKRIKELFGKREI
jgi:NAD(P)H-flavin reductase